MVSQYPHIILIPPGKPGNTPFNTTTARYEPEAPADLIEQSCRYEPSPITRELQLTDGSSVKYKGIVYLPLTAPDIPTGLLVEIVGVVKMQTLYFYRGQLHCMLYL